ncbi:glycosyltransferase family 4 protein [Methyloceanibacter sp.]|uniref:glycosyltransferase family 4 protein n=1 Tax=Methyloceanibacter sp. TaxID=1965321 RepID=UPI002D31A80A|nr:glycosyltransferase family 4 protein [Methyloceanibacter sp.]HZP09033.1 glycosyltransferase family 4 protein [Methyloceanibacter sp.]
MGPRLLYVVTEDWYFLSHRLPMARAARDAGYEVHVATRIKDGRAAIEREGFVPHALSWSRGSLSALGSVSAVRELRRLFRAVGPAIVHNIALKPVLLGTTASLGLPRIAVVNSLTGLGTLFIGEAKVSGATRRLVRFALARLLRRGESRTVVQNPDDRAFVLGLGVPEECIVVIAGSGVDTDVLRPLPEPPLPATAAYVGRMLADKGVITLIEAFSSLGKRGVPLKLLLAGDCDKENPGSLAPEQLREFASLYGVEWLGHVSDIRTVWARANFAVLASRREGLPKSLLEAAACGRAMVATDAPGCREIAIEGVTALTVPVDDAPALASAMEKLAGDADLRQRFAANARALVESRFSAEAIGKETVALYDSIRTT